MDDDDIPQKLETSRVEPSTDQAEIAEQSYARPERQFDALLKKREEEHARELADREGRALEWERAYKTAIREKELATALSGQPLAPGASAQLVRLWCGELDVFEQDGTVRVATRDGRTVAQAVAEWLASPDYAHFCQPMSRGGTIPSGSSRHTTGMPANSTPRTLGDIAIQQWREGLTNRGTENVSPIGLHRRR